MKASKLLPKCIALAEAYMQFAGGKIVWNLPAYRDCWGAYRSCDRTLFLNTEYETQDGELKQLGEVDQILTILHEIRHLQQDLSGDDNFHTKYFDEEADAWKLADEQFYSYEDGRTFLPIHIRRLAAEAIAGFESDADRYAFATAHSMGLTIKRLPSAIWACNRRYYATMLLAETGVDLRRAQMKKLLPKKLADKEFGVDPAILAKLVAKVNKRLGHYREGSLGYWSGTTYHRN